MLQKELGLKDVINPKDWHAMQESLSEALEVTLRTFAPDGSILAETTRNTRLSTEILPKVLKGTGCVKYLFETNFIGIKEIRSETNLKAPFGLDIFVVPITAVGNRVAAYLVLGPVILKARKSISEYTKDAQLYGIKLEELMDGLIEINVFSYTKLRAIISVIQEVFSRIAQAGYHKKRLGEIAPEIIELDPVFSKYYEEKILTALLDACTFALNADSGSVMIVDKKTNMLYIKAAAKLDQKVVKSAKVRMGEGIAGMAAATAESIILPQDKEKRHLSGKLKRSDIKSSIVMPFSKANDHDVYGVLNLNMIRKGRDFAERDIALVKELVHMAGIALIPIRQATVVPDKV